MENKNRRRLLLAASLALTAPAAGSKARAADAPRVLAEFPLEPGADSILLPVRVGGRDREFMLDTGSTFSVFDRGLSSGPPVALVPVGPPSGRAVAKLLYAAPEASLGGLDMRPSGPVLYNNFAAMRAVSDRDIWGLIGMRFLRNYIVQVDFDALKVRFLDPRTSPRPDWGSPVPMRIGDAGIPVVAARIAGHGPEELEIDTGDNGGGNLARALFERLFPGRRGARGRSLLFTGLRSSPSGRLPGLSLGGLTFHGLIFESADLSSLGLALFRRGAATFDFPRGTLYLKAGRRLDVEEAADMSGLHVLRLEGRIVALAVDPGSPAARAGLVGGDVILGAEGRPEASDDVVALRRLLRSGDGERVTLDVLRGGRPVPFELRLKKLL